MSRAPMNVPVRGDRVRLRGREATGTLRTLDEESKWACVEWDIAGPKFCHLHELEIVSDAKGALRTVAEHWVGPHEQGGLKYGGHIVVQEFKK